MKALLLMALVAGLALAAGCSGEEAYDAPDDTSTNSQFEAGGESGEDAMGSSVAPDEAATDN
jgi:ABC-type glycerol-3-phosphate transport system substrate-binding protein